MKKRLLYIFLCCITILGACGNDSGNMESSEDMDMDLYSMEEAESVEFGVTMNSGSDEQQAIEPREENSSSNEDIKNHLERKVIYTANLQIEVKSYQETFNDIQAEVTKQQGYIVESTMYEDPENTSKHGQITVRIPVENFSEFVKLVEDGSSKVLESSTSGQDVTEEYVDIESRLTSKRVVEERLLSFMEEAEKTEDLLKISNDLAKVQEEIEELTGRMKYLENRSDLATVSIHMQENNITLSGTGKDNLNTWEQTKQQFKKSINFIINAFSSLVVLIVGNLPVILLVIIIGLIVFFIGKNRWNKVKETNKEEENS